MQILKVSPACASALFAGGVAAGGVGLVAAVPYVIGALGFSGYIPTPQNILLRHTLRFASEPDSMLCVVISLFARDTRIMTDCTRARCDWEHPGLRSRSMPTVTRRLPP